MGANNSIPISLPSSSSAATSSDFTPLPPGSDPLTQYFDISDSHGRDIEVGMDTLASLVKDGVTQSILQASQIGAAVAVLIMLLILTRPEKRRLPVFTLNVLALLLTIVAQVLVCLYYTSSWYTPYARVTSDYSFVSASAVRLVMATPVALVLVVVALEASLVLQVHVVCVTLTRPQRYAVTCLSAIVAALPVAIRIAQVVDNFGANVSQRRTGASTQWLVQARDVSLAVSICFFSAVFVTRLGWSLLQRRRMGLRQFGPMQVVLIGGAQTMIIPAGLAVVQFIEPRTRVNSFILTITVLSLPLTSLWASAAATHATAAAAAAAPPAMANAPHAHGAVLVQPGVGRSDRSRLVGGGSAGTFLTSPTASDGGFSMGRKGKNFFSGWSLGGSLGSGMSHGSGGTRRDTVDEEGGRIVGDEKEKGDVEMQLVSR